MHFISLYLLYLHVTDVFLDSDMRGDEMGFKYAKRGFEGI